MRSDSPMAKAHNYCKSVSQPHGRRFTIQGDGQSRQIVPRHSATPPVFAKKRMCRHSCRLLMCRHPARSPCQPLLTRPSSNTAPRSNVQHMLALLHTPTPPSSRKA